MTKKIQALAVPAYEAALSLPESQQNLAINDFLEVVRSRLAAVVPLDHSTPVD